MNCKKFTRGSLIASLRRTLVDPNFHTFNTIKNCAISSTPEIIGELLVAAANTGVIRDVELYVPIAIGNNLENKINESLCEASQNAHVTVMAYLLKNGADIHHNNELPLRKAIAAGCIESVDFLLDNGADVHVNNDELLVYCCTSGDYPNIVSSLISHKIDVLKNYKTALEICYNKKHMDSASKLVQYSNIESLTQSTDKYSITREDIDDIFLEYNPFSDGSGDSNSDFEEDSSNADSNDSDDKSNNIIHLSTYGYSIGQNESERRNALSDASKKNGALSVLKRLNLLRNYLTVEKDKEVIAGDIEFMKEFYTREELNKFSRVMPAKENNES